MEINRQNYELFAVEYLDGKLTTEQAAAFMAFLAANPDISFELEQLRAVNYTPVDKPVKMDFSFLKRDIDDATITKENFEEMCIAWHEGDLSEVKREQLLAFIGKDKQRQNTFEMYGILKIKPEISVVFKNKKSLKQQATFKLTARRTLLIASLSTAAALATVFILRNPGTGIDNQSGFSEVQRATEQLAVPEQAYTVTESEAKTGKFFNAERKSKTTEPAIINPEEDYKTQLAVIDTNQPEEDEYIRISRIEPGLIPANPTEVKLKPVKQIDLQEELFMAELSKRPVEGLKDYGLSFIAMAENLTVNDIIRTGIEGINRVAETDILYRSRTNSEGKITEFALSTEKFGMKRKTGNN
ncbi:MAG: hypothetical protein JXA77_05535 [Bacteroidales bacterium]|nr:hypothetical protein [Bacteroidales bacterium]